MEDRNNLYSIIPFLLFFYYLFFWLGFDLSCSKIANARRTHALFLILSIFSLSQSRKLLVKKKFSARPWFYKVSYIKMERMSVRRKPIYTIFVWNSPLSTFFFFFFSFFPSFFYIPINNSFIYSSFSSSFSFSFSSS